MRVLLLALLLAPAAWAQAEPEPEPVRVLVLTTYHFANPGLDLGNVVADDVLAPHRQREVIAIARALATFRPTAVATERRDRPPYDDRGWPVFTDSVYTFAPDEAIQIGFRVAQLAGADRVYAIDEQTGDGDPGYFPFGAVDSLAARLGRSQELASITSDPAEIEAFALAQDTLTLPELLLPEQADDDQFYWDVLTFGDGEDQPGPELAAYWFMRNAKIFNKLVQVTQPGDRVLLVFGSGHGAWLREMIRQTSGFELEPAEPYLHAAIAALAAADH